MASFTATGQIWSWLETRPLKEGIVLSSPGLPARAAIRHTRCQHGAAPVQP